MMKYKVINDKEIPVLTASLAGSGIAGQQNINNELALIDDLLSIQKSYASQMNKHALMKMLEKRIETEISFKNISITRKN